MTTETLSFEQFSELLDALGGTLCNWPAEMREAAERLLTESPEAAAHLAEAQRIDDAVKLTQPRAPAGLVDRIMQASGAEARSSDKTKRDDN